MGLWVGMTEYQAYLISAGLLKNPIPEDDIQGFLALSTALAASQNRFERAAGWNPFVWDGSVSTRVFDAEGQKTLDLQGGLLRLESVSVGNATYDMGSVWPGPPNALAKGQAYTYLELWRLALYFPGSVPGMRALSVTGDWGRVYTLADAPDVAMAVMAGAMLQLGPQFMAVYGAGVVEWKTAETSERLRDNPLAYALAGADGKGGPGGASSLFNDAVCLWRRYKLP